MMQRTTCAEDHVPRNDLAAIVTDSQMPVTTSGWWELFWSHFNARLWLFNGGFAMAGPSQAGRPPPRTGQGSQGAKDFKQALSYSIAPGKYTVVIKIPGQPPQTEQIEPAAGSTWGIITLPTGGYLPLQLY
jgi:hypothetical protein